MSLDLKPGRTFVIAEAGTGHAAHDPAKRFENAKVLCWYAAQAGADAIKFQWFTGSGPLLPILDHGALQEDMFCRIMGDSARAPRWEASILGFNEWLQIKEYAEACGLVFLASAFQNRTVSWLISMQLAATKVASRAAKDFPYTTPLLPRPLLVSDGMLPFTIPMGQMGLEIGDCHILQCEAKYPSTTAWKGTGGFSDHSGLPFLGIDAISRGCPILEVHFMVKELDAGPDLPACLTVEDLKLICDARDYYHDRNCAA